MSTIHCEWMPARSNRWAFGSNFTGSLSLHHIRVGVRSKSSSAVLRKLLEWNRRGDLTWFFLNKQAAYSRVISLAEHYEESPLGPIKVTITSNNLDRIIEWLLSSK